MRHEIMFIDPRISEADRNLFMGPFDDKDGPIFDIQPGWTMAHLMVSAGIFFSVKQAKNNGWDKPIPIGYDEFIVGKQKLKIFTLTKFD